jgi:DNA-binding winged helix-turn-helix (wHTH) protein
MTTVRSQFGPFSIDADARQLFRGEVELHLSPKAFDLLCLLIQERPKVIERRELHARIWPATHVVDANLNVLVAEIRRALGDNPQQPQYIRTVHGVGFAFCGQLAAGAMATLAGDVIRCWVVAPDGTFRLSEGDNIVGRDPLCHVFLDTPGVSRRHAILRVDSPAKAVVVRDLGSTNGTLVGGTPVTQVTELNDGDVVTVGSVELTVRVRRSDTLPETQRIRSREERRKNEERRTKDRR